MKKKLLCGFLSLVFCLSLSGISVFAMTAETDDAMQRLEDAIVDVLNESHVDIETNEKITAGFEDALVNALDDIKRMDDEEFNVAAVMSNAYEATSNVDDNLTFTLTTRYAIPKGCPESDVTLSLSGDLFATYEPDMIVLNSTGETVIGNSGIVRSADGKFLMILEYGPNSSNNGYVDFFFFFEPFSAEDYVRNMFMNGSPEQYAEMHTNIVDGKTVAYQYGQYTDYADGGSEVFHCNLCVDLGNDTHLGVRLYNFVPIVDYESGQTFVIDDGIIPVIVDGIVGF